MSQNMPIITVKRKPGHPAFQSLEAVQERAEDKNYQRQAESTKEQVDVPTRSEQ